MKAKTDIVCVSVCVFCVMTSCSWVGGYQCGALQICDLPVSDYCVADCGGSRKYCVEPELRTINSEHNTCFIHVFNGTVHRNISSCINMKTAKSMMKTEQIQRYTLFTSLRKSINKFGECFLITR